MKIGDIIEIVTYEGRRLHLRRVKVTRVRKSRVSGCDCGNPDCGSGGRSDEQKYVIKAGNLHGKYERAYTLPLEPITEIRDPKLYNSTNWIIPTDLNGPVDP